MSHRWVSEKALVDRIRKGRPVLAWLRRQPTAPDLVGAQAAARILGVKTPHLARLREQERMPQGIPVEGTNDAYVRQEVEALARQLAKERAKRAARRAERSGSHENVG